MFNVRNKDVAVVVVVVVVVELYLPLGQNLSPNIVPQCNW